MIFARWCFFLSPGGGEEYIRGQLSAAGTAEEDYGLYPSTRISRDLDAFFRMAASGA